MTLTSLNLLDISLLGAGMILLILVIRTLFKNRLSSGIIMLFWYSAILRLLLPFSVAVPINIGIRLLKWPFHAFSSGDTGTDLLPETLTKLANDTAPLGKLSLTLATAWQSDASIQLLSLIWLAGMLLVSTYFVIIYVRSRCIFKESLPLNKHEAMLILNQLHIRRKVEVRTLDKIASPLTYGVLKPVILLPRKLINENTSQQELWQCILLHEGIHIKRYDALLKLILAATLAIHWFNPFVWLLYSFANRDIELCCDEAVITQIGEKKKRFYASALLYMEEARYKSPAFYTCFSRNILEERIQMIMKKKKITGLSVISGIVAIICVCTAFASNTNSSPGGRQSVTQPVAEHTQPTVPALENDSLTAAQQMSASSKTASSPSSEKLSFSEELPSFIWPVENCTVISATFGERIHPITGQVRIHDHITIRSEAGIETAGSVICAVADGIVVESDYDSENGYYLTIEHGNGLSTVYTHCQTIDVNTGSTVAQGEVIGTVGQTGMATGACLGFYVYQNGEAQNPLDYYPEADIH